MLPPRVTEGVSGDVVHTLLIFALVAGTCAATSLRLAWLAHRGNDADREEHVLDREVDALSDRWELVRSILRPKRYGAHGHQHG